MCVSVAYDCMRVHLVHIYIGERVSKDGVSGKQVCVPGHC